MKALELPGGLTLRYLDLPGEGRPLVFLHGLGCASSCDYPAVARYGPLVHRRALLVDLPGYGFSDKPADVAYGVDDQAACLATAIERLGLPSFDLYGHSMGGSIAITLARRCGPRVHRLVVSEPNLDAGGGLFSRALAAQPQAEYVAQGHARVVQEARASGNTIWAGSMAVALPLAVHQGAVSLVKGAQPSWREQLLALPQARTMIFGAHSLPHDDASGLPAHGVRVQVVSDAGHSMAWDNPAGLAHAIAAGLDD